MTEKFAEIYDAIGKAGIIPVIKLERVEDAVPLARALLEGGIPVAEVTFRTEAAAAGIAAIRRELPQMLVGAGTVRTEGYAGDLLPAQTQSGRARRGLAAHPGIAVVSTSLDLDPESGFFAEAPVRPLILTAAAAPESRRSALEEVADVVVAGARTVEPRQAAAVLAGRGHRRVLCEGGPQLFGSFQSAGLVDELCLTLAPVLAAGAAGRISAGAPELGLARLRLAHVLRSGDTLLLRYLAS